MKNKFFITICISVVILMSLLTSCNRKEKVAVICPNELKTAISKTEDLADARELLFNADYSIVIVKDDMGEIKYVQHYRPEHTFIENLHPTKVTFENPMHISTLAIFDKGQGKYGVAIQRKNDMDWKVYWFKDNELNSNVNYIYLPSLEKLESLNTNPKP